MTKEEIDAMVADFLRRNGLGDGQAPTQPVGPFPAPIPASELKKVEGGARWIWKGCLARGGVTLFSALWKAGKSTLLSHLLKAAEGDTPFCGLDMTPAPVLYVTEETEGLWADRRDAIRFGDNSRFQVRPFTSKPTWPQWFAFLAHLKQVRDVFPYGVLILDTLSNLWPLRDENEATQMQSVLMPLHAFGPEVAILAVHHLRKGGGDEATASRGSGALGAFVDVVLELRRYDAASKSDTRRMLTGYGRYEESNMDVVLDLTPEGFVGVGTRAQTRQAGLAAVLPSVLPRKAPGDTIEAILGRWPGEGTRPTHKAVADALKVGHEAGEYRREGGGKKGSPYTFWMPLENSYSPHAPIGARNELGNVDCQSGSNNTEQAFGDDE